MNTEEKLLEIERIGRIVCAWRGLPAEHKRTAEAAMREIETARALYDKGDRGYLGSLANAKDLLDGLRRAII